MLYDHLWSLKDCGYCSHESRETCRKRFCKNCSWMGDDGALDKRMRDTYLDKKPLDEGAYIESWKKCGKKINVNKDKSFCSRDTVTFKLSQYIRGESRKDCHILQNVKPEKSLAKLYVSLYVHGDQSEEYVSAQVSFFRNFAFYDWCKIKTLWKEFKLPDWDSYETTYEAQRLVGIKNRTKDPPLVGFPIDYTDNEFTT